MKLCETLLLDYPEKLNGKAGPLHRAIIMCITSSSSEARKKCISILQRMVNNLGGVTLSRAILKDLVQFLEVAKIQKRNMDAAENGDACNYISPHVLVQCIITLCSIKGLSQDDAQLLAIDALKPTQHPSIVEISHSLWVKITGHLKIKPSHLVTQQQSKLLTALVEEYEDKPVSYFINYLN